MAGVYTHTLTLLCISETDWSELTALAGLVHSNGA